MANEILKFETIKKMYPNEWVLIGNPELREPEVEMAIALQLIKNTDLFISFKKFEITVNE